MFDGVCVLAMLKKTTTGKLEDGNNNGSRVDVFHLGTQEVGLDKGADRGRIALLGKQLGCLPQD